jgi:hypothetical protein
MPEDALMLGFMFRGSEAVISLNAAPDLGRWPAPFRVLDASDLHAACGALTLSTAYLYDWNLLPIGQLLWEKHQMTYKEFPPLQAPETYNLDGILKQMQSKGTKGD